MSVFCTVKITLNVIMHRGCKGLIWIQNEWYTYRGGDYLFFFFFCNYSFLICVFNVDQMRVCFILPSCMEEGDC